jgi:hypothetical protein
MMMVYTGNTSILRWSGSWWEKGYRGGGCNIVWLIVFSLVCLICE